MMVRVTILAGEADETIGEFELDQVPRRGESVCIPCPADEYGVRWFVVDEVNHVATGADCQFGKGPLTVLRYSEEVS